jgi:hypothetical protein
VIQDYLRKNEISIISGKFKFDEKGLPLPYSYVVQVINGKTEVVFPFAKQTAKPVYPKPPWGK